MIYKIIGFSGFCFSGGYMKKIIASAVLLFCAFTLFSASLVFKGSGDTYDEAYLNAYEALLSAVETRIEYNSFSTALSTEESGDSLSGGGTELQTLSADELSCLKIAESMDDGKYYVTLKFSDEEKENIEKEATELVSLIDKECQTLDDYIAAFKSYEKYRILQYAAGELGGSIASPSSDMGVKEASFSLMLKEEINSLKKELRYFSTTIKRREEVNERLSYLESLIDKYNLAINYKDKMPDPSEIIAVIEEEKSSYNKIFAQKEEQIRYYIRQTAYEIKAVEDEIEKRAWTRFDYDSSGEVSENAKLIREAEKTDRINESIKSLEEEISNNESLYKEQTFSLLSSLGDNYNLLSRTPQQTVSAASEDLTFYVASYDSEKENWTFTCRLGFPFTQVLIKGEIPLSVVTKVFGSDALTSGYDEMIGNINKMDALLKSQSGISVDVVYTLRPTRNVSEYNIILKLSLSYEGGIFYSLEQDTNIIYKPLTQIVHRVYGFGTNRNGALTSLKTRLKSEIGVDKYDSLLEGVAYSQYGSLCIATVDINNKSIESLINEIDNNNQKLVQMSLPGDLLKIRRILVQSESTREMLNQMGFYFEYEYPYDINYIDALYSAYCQKNGYNNSLIDNLKNKLSASDLKKAEEMGATVLSNSSRSSSGNMTIDGVIDNLESLKREFSVKKEEIRRELETIETENSHQLQEQYDYIDEIFNYTTNSDSGTAESYKEIKKNKLKEELEWKFNKLLEYDIYMKKSELVAALDFTILDDIREEIQRMGEETVTTDSVCDSSLSLAFGGTDLEKREKPFVFLFKHGNNVLELSDSLNVASFFEEYEDAFSEMGADSFNEYKEKADILDYAAMTSDLFVARLDYSIVYTDLDDTNCRYSIILQTLRILRSDTLDVLYEYKFDGRTFDITMESVDYLIEDVEKPSDFEEIKSLAKKRSYIAFDDRNGKANCGLGLRMVGSDLAMAGNFGFLICFDRVVVNPLFRADFSLKGVGMGFSLDGMYRVSRNSFVGLGVVADLVAFHENGETTEEDKVNLGTPVAIYGSYYYSRNIFYLKAEMGIVIYPKASFYFGISLGGAVTFEVVEEDL